MALDTHISIPAAQAMLDALGDLFDPGGSPGEIHVFEGVPNADAAVTPAGALLAILTLSATAFGAASSASPSVITAAAITNETSAVAGGEAGCFWAGAVATPETMATGYIQGTAGTASTDLVFDDATIVVGGTVAITAWTISMPTT